MSISKIQSISLLQEISDGRLDTILKIFAEMKSVKENQKRVRLDWTKVKKITPAGYAILACLFDTAVEQKVEIENFNLQQSLRVNPVIKNLESLSRFKELPKPEIHYFENSESLLEGHELSIHPDFMDRVEWKFKKNLSEDLIFSCRLILNELMVNCIDHSTAERYYLYAGRSGEEFHLGALDMGITIPAKLERKYSAEEDVELLEMSFKEGITTRRQRTGGFGLYQIFEHLKQNEGKLTILSRDAQVRRYFNRRSVIKGSLKYTLDGTWCFARFSL